MKAAFQSKMNTEFEAGKDYKPNKADWLDGKWSHLDRNKDDYVRGDTAIKPETMAEIGTALSTAPDGFPVHKTVGRLLDSKAKMFESGSGFDWATGEALAFGSLLTEGYPVRLSGQDQHTRHIQPTPLGPCEPRHRRTVLSTKQRSRGSSTVRSHRLNAV